MYTYLIYTEIINTVITHAKYLTIPFTYILSIAVLLSYIKTKDITIKNIIIILEAIMIGSLLSIILSSYNSGLLPILYPVLKVLIAILLYKLISTVIVKWRSMKWDVEYVQI